MAKFIKGQSGNPGGRPKREWTWAEELEKAANETEPKSGKQWRELISKRVIMEAASGNMLATKELMNRLDGMPTQKNEVSGPDGNAIKLNIFTGTGFYHIPGSVPTTATSASSLTGGPTPIQDISLASAGTKDNNSDHRARQAGTS